jgi:sortase (surface protein transpeptidase)
MAATSRPPQRKTEDRNRFDGLTRKELHDRLEEDLRQHPTRSRLRSWGAPGSRKRRRHDSARYRRQRILAIIGPALVAGAAVLLVVGSSDSPSVDGPPVPKGLAERAAKEKRRPSVITAPAVKSVPHRHPIGPIRPPRPVKIAIPSLDISAPVGAVGAVKGRIGLPPVTRAGWFKAGPRPGEPGRTVIIGHLDTKKAPAVFAHLPDARRGDAIEVTDAGGRARRYVVVSAISAPKEFFPVSQVYAPTPTSTLALITCGGAFDTKTRHYEDNVVVYAQLAGQRRRS